MNPFYMNKDFRLRVIKKAVRSQYRLYLEVSKINQISFDSKSIKNLEFSPTS